MEFKQLGISAPLLRALQEEGYSAPTPIQEKTIPATLKGNDVLGLAQTGTGKTAAFAVPTLQLLSQKKPNSAKRKIRSLILTPTRELAIQIQESFAAYGRYMSLKSTVIYGGVGQGSQVRALRSGVDILIATPGRLKDLIDQRHVDISAVEIFVLDEADRMLDMGFIHDVRRIIKLLPKQKQTLFFSATMPKEITEIVNELLVNPTQVSVAPVSSTVDTVQQFVYFVDRTHKTDVLADFLKENENDSVLIFTRTKRGSDRVVKDLTRRKITAQAIHGNKSQNARKVALDNFKNYRIQVLVATDIASRGIDINELKYVINYDLPEVPETYVHRIGRTGRAGNTGIAISLCSFQEMPLFRDIEKLIKKNIQVLENEKYPMMDKTAKPTAKAAKASKPSRKKQNSTKEKASGQQASSKNRNFKSPSANTRRTRSRKPRAKA